MSCSIRLLLAGQSGDDVAPILGALEVSGYQVCYTRVVDGSGFRSALENEYDVIICEHSSGFDAISALGVLRQIRRCIPLIVISDIGDEALVVDVMRHGASDFLRSSDLARLGNVVGRGIRAAECDRLAEEAARSQAALLRIAGSMAHIGGWIVELQSKRVIYTDSVGKIFDLPGGGILSHEEALNCFTGGGRRRIEAVLRRCVTGGLSFDEEVEMSTHTGKRVWVRLIAEAIRDDSGRVTGIQGALQDMTEKRTARAMVDLLATSHREAEEITRNNEIRYLRQRNALISLTKNIPSEGGALEEIIRSITRSTAETLDVERVSVWRFINDGTSLECRGLYEYSGERFSAGMRLYARDYPQYFQSLPSFQLYATHDARLDSRTAEFTAGYLEPLGITSLLEAPIHFTNESNHFLCLEHVGKPRYWTADEKTFAIAVGNLVSLALESSARAEAQAEVLRSHLRFQTVAAATSDAIWDWNIEAGTVWWNDGFVSLFGWDAAKPGCLIQDWTSKLHPEDRNRVVDGIQTAIAQGSTQWEEEYRFMGSDEKIYHVMDRAQIIRDTEGRAVRMVSGMRDLSFNRAAEVALRRSHRALRMLSSCNEMLIRASDESELVEGACRMAVEIGGYRMAWVGYAEKDGGKAVIPKAHAGIEEGFLSELEITWDDTRRSGWGPAGRSIRSGEMVIINDIFTDHSLAHLHKPSAERGYKCIISLPLRKGDEIFGVLCLYGAERYVASAGESELLITMANDVAFGITNIRERLERQKAQDVVVRVAQAVSDGAHSEFFDLLTLNMVEALGATGGGVGRYIPHENQVETISMYFRGEFQPVFRYCLSGTPCENVASGDICIFGQGVQQLFPEDHFLVANDVEAYAGIPLCLQNGKVGGVMMVLFDHPLEDVELARSTLKIFAARASAEMDRRVSDARIREQASLLDKAQDAILVRDLDHTITYWNKSAERLYGWSADEALGQSVEELLYRENTSFIRAHAHTLKYGEWMGELTQIDKTGRVLTIEGRWTLVCDEEGNPLSVFAINTDISEQRRLEEQFIKAQRLESLGTLAGGIAHDLNNILAPITMAVELLKMRITDDRSAELLDTVSSSAKRGADMVGQVLSFARGMEVRRVEVHPKQLIREIEGILRDTLLKGVNLEVSIPRELWTVHGDPTQLHQVILNLCVNAKDAIAGEGQIEIIASNVFIDSTFAAMNLEATEGPHVCIQVEDTGEGIPHQIIDKIFDPFFTSKSVGKGTGLGLSTSLAIVKGHGGFIRVSSTKGKGAIFKVYLPANPELDEPDLGLDPRDIPQGHGETILIVDDEESIREITRQALESFGYRTLLASNGDQALATYAANQTLISAVITDMMMPGMDGQATIQFLRKINPSVKVIAASGITSYREVADSLDVEYFLQKPYDAWTLLSCLNLVLSAPRRR